MRILVFTILAFLLVSCGEKKPDCETVHIKATKLNSDLFMGMPVVIHMAPQDSILWVSDFQTEYLVSGVDKRTGNVLCRIARLGRGPSEMLPPAHIFSNDNKYLNLYDRNMRKLYNIPTDSALAGNGRLYNIASFSSGYSLVHSLTDSTYFGVGNFGGKRLSVTDALGRELFQTGELPEYWDGERSLSTRVRSMYHQANRQCRHPSDSLFAICTSDILTIYSSANNTVTEKSEILLHNYEYDFSEGEFVSTNSRPHVPYGIMDIACDNRYIYVLYDPNTSAKSSAELSSEIRLYTWDGALVKKIVSDVNLSIIAMDTQDNAIYGINTDASEPAMWRIQM